MINIKLHQNTGKLIPACPFMVWVNKIGSWSRIILVYHPYLLPFGKYVSGRTGCSGYAAYIVVIWNSQKHCVPSDNFHTSIFAKIRADLNVEYVGTIHRWCKYACSSIIGIASI